MSWPINLTTSESKGKSPASTFNLYTIQIRLHSLSIRRSSFEKVVAFWIFHLVNRKIESRAHESRALLLNMPCLVDLQNLKSALSMATNMPQFGILYTILKFYLVLKYYLVLDFVGVEKTKEGTLGNWKIFVRGNQSVFGGGSRPQ